MKPIIVPRVITFIIALVFAYAGHAQFSATASAVRINDCTQDAYLATTGSIAPAGGTFTNTNLGSHTQNSGSLVLRGGAVRTAHTPGASNVCSARMYYRIYPQGGSPGSFSSFDLTDREDCDASSNTFLSSGTSCSLGDQLWSVYADDGATNPAPVDLTAFSPGNYTLEVYYEVSGSATSASLCDQIVSDNNSGNNYKASFSIQQPVLSSSNPTTCNGSEGSITIGGLTAGATYILSYADDGNTVGPLNMTANASGQIVISSLKAGIYSNFQLTINGCETDMANALRLTDPIITPKFNKINPFCAGTTAPSLQTTSNNGIAGTWSPSVIDNQHSGTYTFTPNTGQCGVSVNVNVTVIPRTVPTFSFGTSLTICAGGTVPSLPSTSTNSITGTWSPAVVDNQNSNTYTFTPSAGQCATTATFTVTVTPNVTPTFSFGTSLTFCAGASAPALPTTSSNGITGTWSPATIDNQNSGNYTFTPSAGLCAPPISLSVTVNPNVTPTFSFGTALTLCIGSTAPSLPTTSNNGISGTWSPSTVDNQNSGTYTFTPTPGQCATSTTFNVTVNPKTTPTFGFGTSITICAGAAVPTLTGTSANGIVGTWSPSAVDNQNSGTYTFTPNAGQCANTTTFTVTVNPNITPAFSFGNNMTICQGASVPTLPATSSNGISGSWSPATVDNQNSGTYTFTPNGGQCATAITFNVTVNPTVVPVFGFGTSSTICAGASVPSLPSTSSNGVNGTWSPATVDNQHSATYTFTPTAGQCATTTSFAVTVTPNTVPTFSFGTTLTICAGNAVPTLPSTSTNGISGTWNPATIDNQNSGTYTFTPAAGPCATVTTLTVTVNPIVTPTFSFGTAATFCAGASVPALPGTSSNGITGTWSPSVVDNQNSGTYTFTPGAGQCASTATFNVTVNGNITPVFSFGASLTVCAGSSVPLLPTTSNNGISGTWSPSAVDNQASGTYTFTPASGVCAPQVTFAVTVTPKATPTFGFGTALTICAGTSVPVLPGSSSNGISGSWSPATVDNQNSGTYTFTPDAGQCANSATFTVTVNPNVTPAFSFGTSLTICAGATVPTLTTTSNNGITGTWSTATIDNQNSGSYTFTPTAGQCAVATTLSVTVTPNTMPVFSFGNTLTICAGSTVPTLPGTSNNGIAGTWSPAVIDNQTSATYTFTPATGQCATITTFVVTVNAKATPTFSFGTSLSICAGAGVPTLATTSTNGITGTWSPATIDNQASGTYVFTPDAGQCANGTTLNVTVNPIVTPTFSFGTTLTICAGSSVPLLPANSVNGIAGTWSPAVIDNQNSGTYTFTPGAGQCATNTTFTVTVNPNVQPTFSFGSTLTICAGSSVPSLPGTSTNGITGTWSPASVDNQNSGTYTFTPASGVCATVATFTVTVNPIVTPTFSFGTSYALCAGATAPLLPSTSANGVTGTWSPAAIDNQNSGTYTFTPDPGQCAVSTSLTVTVHANVTPTFSFGTSLTICQGSAVPTLPSTSSNGVPGTWSAASVDNQNSGTYTFTPSAGQCAVPINFNVTVKPSIVPTFSFGTTLTICAGSSVPALPTMSTNGFTGTWSPSTVDNQASAVYTFTPDPIAGQCLVPATFTVTVNQIVTPAFKFGNALSFCAGSTPPVLPSASTNGVSGVWTPAIIDNQTSGTYVFTSDPGQCAAPSATLTVAVTPVPTVNRQADTSVNDGAVIPANNLIGTPAGASFNWTNTNTVIGLAAAGSGNVPSFTANNKGNNSEKGTITVTPTYNGCTGTAVNYVVTVIPLDKGVFVPNVFSPNGDGKNDILYAYGNYVSKIEMRIFNQWGQQIQLITDVHQGWDGRYNGTPQPVGVYVYTLKAVMTDGRTIQLKGNITLLR